MKFLAKMGNDPTIHDHLGEVYFNRRKYREATQQWQAAVYQMKTAAPAEQDAEELAKISKKLEVAPKKVKRNS